jgi:hypothetical protein
MEYTEDVMEDDMNVFIGYLYVCDGEVVKSHMEGKVRDLKLTLKVKEVRTCNPFARGIQDQMEPFVLNRFEREEEP